MRLARALASASSMLSALSATRRLVLPAVLALGTLGPAAAQEPEPPMRPGEGFLTRFSGTIAGPDGKAVIDLGGTVGSVIDLRNPGFRAQGQHWIDEPQRLPVTAADVGQVYGVALDGESPPNVYLTATSAFGLHRGPDGSDWMAGQWGPGAGPGAVWKLDARRNYAPALFATIALDGRPNTGAALGNIAFDKAHRQFFVSDLETGMIHRLGVDGRDLGRFDHGVEGRANFVDVPAGAGTSLPTVAFDPASRARIDDCPDGKFAETPACWNVADPRRRIWGIGVRTDKATRETRLFYAVWSGVALGAPDFATLPETEKTGTVWSIGIGPNGDFDRSSVRREFEVPEFFVQQEDFGRAGPSHPVADIAFPDCYDQGLMVISERGGLRNLGLDAEEPFATPRESRVLRYELDQNGKWVATGRYDVGFAERKPPMSQPWLRAGSSGAAAFGLGYTGNGVADPTRPDQSLWMAGDYLCSPDGPCFNPGTQAFDDDSQVHGIQGTPESAFAPLAPSGAFRVYPAGGTVSGADGPQQSFMIDADINVDAEGKPNPSDLARNDATMIGDIAIWQPCDQQAALPEEIPAAASIGSETGPVDLWIRKSAVQDCDFDGICGFVITITSIGDRPWRAPIFIRDMIPAGAELISFTPADPWLCDLLDALVCFRPMVVLMPGEDLVLRIRIRLPEAILVRGPFELDNCVLLEWPFMDPNDLVRQEQAVIVVLTLMGYDPGPFDRIDRDRFARAILRYEADMRLPRTGRIGPQLIDAIFGGLGRMVGDNDPANDLACFRFVVPRVPPVVDGHSRFSTHRRFGSIEHTRWMTHRRWNSPAHNPWQSHFRWASIIEPPFDLHSRAETHLRWGSILHTRAWSHRRDGSFPPFHDARRSHERWSSVHSLGMSHFVGSSIHRVDRSHYKWSSIHGKRESHDRFRSTHSKLETHRKDGSIHFRSLSHTKAQSHHALDRSHSKAGSKHARHDSLFGGGLIEPKHTRALSHFRSASAGHDKFTDPGHKRADSLGKVDKGHDEKGHDDKGPGDQGGTFGGGTRHNRLLSQSDRTNGKDGGTKGHTVAQSRGATGHSTAQSLGPTGKHSNAASKGTTGGHTTAQSRGTTGFHSTAQSAGSTGKHTKAASRATDTTIVHGKAASRGPVHSKKASKGPVDDHGPIIVGPTHSKKASRGTTGHSDGGLGPIGPVHSKKASKGGGSVIDHGHPEGGIGPIHSKKASRGASSGGYSGSGFTGIPSGFGGHSKKASRGGGSIGGTSGHGHSEGGGFSPFGGGGGHDKRASKGKLLY